MKHCCGDRETDRNDNDNYSLPILNRHERSSDPKLMTACTRRPVTVTHAAFLWSLYGTGFEQIRPQEASDDDWQLMYFVLFPVL